MEDNSSWYWGGGIITGLITFVGIWLYALQEWGLLFGLVFGWVPAIIGGIISGIIWPIPALIVGYLILISF